MSVLIVYDSVFGNTEKIAQAAAGALGAKAIRSRTYGQKIWPEQAW